MAFVKRDWHPVVRLLRPELGLLPHNLGRDRVARQFWSLFADPDQVDPSMADIVVDEFQRIYASAGARLAFLTAARNIYLERPFGRGGFYPRLAELEAPALFVWGACDRLIPPGSSATWPSGCPTPSRSCWRTAATCPRSSAPSRRSGCCGASSSASTRSARAGRGRARPRRPLACRGVRSALLAAAALRRRHTRRGRRGPRRADRRAPVRDARGARHGPPAADAGVDGRRMATARHAATRVSLRGRLAQGRHRLRACRGRACSTSAPFVVTSGPILGGCPVFPPDSPWNTDVSAMALAADSATLVGAQAAGHDVHLDFGDTQSEYGIPYALVPATQRRVPIAFGTDGADYGDESDHGPSRSRRAPRSRARLPGSPTRRRATAT